MSRFLLDLGPKTVLLARDVLDEFVAAQNLPARRTKLPDLEAQDAYEMPEALVELPEAWKR
jgi:hypothetical protein